MLKELISIYNYREMLKNMVKKELRVRYKASVLGFFWTFLNPLLMLIVYSIVFSVVMRIKIPQYSYTLFLFVGLIPWTYFNTSVLQGTTAIIYNSNLVKKVYFPRLILPVSTTLTNLANMLLTFIIMFITIIVNKCPITFLYAYLPVIIIIETLLALAISIILSCITVYFRDLEHIISIVMMAWMYVTPVLYNSEYIPDKLYKLFRVNPMMPLIESYRDILMFAKQPDLLGLLYVLMVSILLLVIGIKIFSKLQLRFAEEI